MAGLFNKQLNDSEDFDRLYRGKSSRLEAFAEKVADHIEKHSLFYRVAAVSLAYLTVGTIVGYSMAESQNTLRKIGDGLEMGALFSFLTPLYIISSDIIDLEWGD